MTVSLAERFGTSRAGNYTITDTIGLPHPFMIGPKHVEHAADHCSGMLGERTLRVIPCCWEGCTLTYEQHVHALVVVCAQPVIPKAHTEKGGELHEFLLACKAKMLGENEYAGFAFMHEGRGAKFE